jgi:arylsulfate sulfotransferase
VPGTIQLLSIDHDVLLLPNGHLLILTTDSRVFPDLPGYPGQTTVLGNAIIDVDGDNNIAWVWDVFDHLDVNRHPIYFPDWTHANALFYVPDDGSFLLSLRHQHWILKVDYQNGSGPGDILWKLGYQGDFTMQSDSPADWSYARMTQILSART